MNEQIDNLKITIKELSDKLLEAQDKVKTLEENLPKNESKKTRWKPEKDEKYYLLRDLAKVSIDKYIYHKMDENRYRIGNCYATEELAEKERDKQILITEIWDWWLENDGSNGEYILEYGQPITSSGGIFDEMYTWKVNECDCPLNALIPSFSSEEIAQACIKHFGNRLNILLEPRRWS